MACTARHRGGAVPPSPLSLPLPPLDDRPGPARPLAAGVTAELVSRVVEEAAAGLERLLAGPARR